MGKFDARANIDPTWNDEFTDLADKFHLMAQRLRQQFSARDALSKIDQNILSGADIPATVELVLKTLVENVVCQRAAIFIIVNHTTNRASKTEMSREHPVPRESEVALSGANKKWLEAQQTGTAVSECAETEPSAAFTAFDAKSTFVLPITANRKAAGVVSIVMKDAFTLTEIEMDHIRVLGGRLAVALEAIMRENQLRKRAYFDDLTGLPNREFCFNRLDHAIRKAKRHESDVAVMFVDLDGFKAINDSMGHIVGDEVIRQAADRLSDCVGDSGTIGRLGGDEFGIVLPISGEDDRAEALAEEMIDAIRKPFLIGNSEIHISASIGIAKYPEHGDTRSELLRRADTAMYRAKENGRGQSARFTQTMGLKVDTMIQLQTDLRYALERDEMQLVYQPQMDMRTGRIISAEALLRWVHPTKGVVSPADFIPVAEDAGFINVLGAWVMSNACRQLTQWRELGLGIERVAVNVSAEQFRRDNFIDQVESCLVDLLFEPGALELELTESVFVDNLTRAKVKLDKLKRTGVSISIDDFGTGYSSLGYLKHLTFDIVKVDQSFIHELPEDQTSAAIVNAVVAMTHTLQKRVVAEGVESEEQYNYLREADVDLAQGYHVGKPMSGDALSMWLKALEQETSAAISIFPDQHRHL